jgi:hypothetical protein
LVLTHANATVEEAVPYMQMHATKVLTVAGRSAKVEPVCKPNEAVYCGWRDCLLPLMLCGQVPADTLFLVFEEDFRFDDEEPHIIRPTLRFPETEGMKLVERLRRLPDGVEPSASRQVQAHGDEPSASRGAQASGTKQHGEEPSASHASKRQKGEPSDGSDVPFGWSQSLEDLVAYCNIAAKGKAGDVVWLTWCPYGRGDDKDPKRDDQLVPHHGTTCLGISIRGARAMAHAMERHHGILHFDVWLQRQLSGGEGVQKGDTFGASYLWPPTGSYATHKSGCQVGTASSNVRQGLTREGVRQADWGYPNQPFTRVPPDLINMDRATERPGEKWLKYALVEMAPRRKGTRNWIRHYVHGADYDVASSACDLQDMRKALWWTFARGSMITLKNWYEFDADHHGDAQDTALEHLYRSVHYKDYDGYQSAERSAASDAAPDGSQSAELSAASDAEGPFSRGKRPVRKTNVQLAYRLDWSRWEAWV